MYSQTVFKILRGSLIKCNAVRFAHISSKRIMENETGVRHKKRERDVHLSWILLMQMTAAENIIRSVSKGSRA
jgi:hypothetical protein